MCSFPFCLLVYASSNSPVRCLMPISSPFAVFVVNLPEEAKRVSARLNSLQNFQTSRAAGFWANRDKGLPMVLLQDRIEQARNLLGRCQGALDYIHNALFPLNPRLEGIHQLLNGFKDGARIFQVYSSRDDQWRYVCIGLGESSPSPNSVDKCCRGAA